MKRPVYHIKQVYYFLLQTTTTKNPCGSKTCTCRKYGIRCLRFCGECRGTECTNSKVCVRTLKRAKRSELEKLQYSWITYLHAFFIRKSKFRPGSNILNFYCPSSHMYS